MRTRISIHRASIFVLAIAFIGSAALAQKLTAEEVIAKHIASLGTPAAVAQWKRRLAVGTAEFTMRSSGKRATGQAILASNGADLAFYSTFDLRDYPTERIGYFGNKITIPFVQLGRRSPLGSFLLRYDKYLSSHLFGGTVFSTWNFGNGAAADGQFESEGKKKLDGRDVWVLKYSPKGGIGFESYYKLYFDAATFQHVQTVSRQKEEEGGFADTVGMGHNAGGPWGAGMASNGSTVTETFSDFRTIDGIVLPHKYQIVLSYDGSRGTEEFRWSLNIADYKIVKEFPADFFSFKSDAN
jgi:hypothetical protein